MSLAKRIKKLRNDAKMTLDELATKATISKTYLWELEQDEKGTKKPSADVLLRIAAALSTTIAHLLELPAIQAPTGEVQLSPSLVDFKKRMDTLGTVLTEQDVRDLAVMRFRGGQPQTVEEWQQLYYILTQSERKKSQ